jgi:hypothetical protein
LISESGLALGFSVHEGVLFTVCESFVFQSLFGDLGSGIGIFFVFCTLLHHNILSGNRRRRRRHRKWRQQQQGWIGSDQLRGTWKRSRGQ